MISADKHIVRVWDASSGEGFTSVQPAEPGINDVLVWPDSGLMMLGMDSPRIQARTRALSSMQRCMLLGCLRGTGDSTHGERCYNSDMLMVMV